MMPSRKPAPAVAVSVYPEAAQTDVAVIDAAQTQPPALTDQPVVTEAANDAPRCPKCGDTLTALGSCVRCRKRVASAAWRDKQKANPKFAENEAARKRQERKLDKERQKPAPPIRLVTGSSSLNNLFRKKARNALFTVAPARSEKTYDELRSALQDAETDVEKKVLAIREAWKSDRDFCLWLDDLSLDEVTGFVDWLSTNLDTILENLTVGDTLNEMTDEKNRPTNAAYSGPPQKLGHGPDAFEADDIDFGKSEKRQKFIEPKFGTRIEVLNIGGRPVRFFNIQGEGGVEKHFENFVRLSIDRDHEGVIRCRLCEKKLKTEEAPKHLGLKHRKDVIEYIRWYEAKAWRPPRRKNCTQADHDRLVEERGPGYQCGRCLKVLY